MSLCFILLASVGFGQSERVIRVGITEYPPFIIKHADGSYSGVSVSLWEDIAAEADLPFRYVEFNDILGMLRALDYQEVDITINPVHVTEARLNFFDATQPFFVSRIGVATTSSDKSQLGIFLSNFFSIEFLRVILFLLLIIFVFGTILWIAERRHNKRQFRPGIVGLFDGLWWSAVTMTTVGYGDMAPKTRLGRVIAMVWMFSAVVIISGFTATIASTLTVRSLLVRIDKLDDLRATNRLGAIYASSSEDFLRNNDIAIQSVYDTPQDALRALANRKIEVLVYDKTEMDYLISAMQLGGRVTLLPVNFNTQYGSFLLPRGSALYDGINALLVRRINEVSWQDVLKSYNLQAH